MVNKNKKLRWGILSSAKIGLEKVMPAIQASGHKISAIASRDPRKTKALVKKYKIDYGFAGGNAYEELIHSPDVDIVYNPLPNHLHAPLTNLAIKAGKHVLCEKPFAMDAREAQSTLTLLKRINARTKKKVLVEEAFMVKHHIQWHTVKKLITSGKIGRLLAIQGCFSYFNADPKNIRNNPKTGGGGLYDIGCYLIQASRYFSGEEPTRVAALIENDSKFKTDRLTSALFSFKSGVQATWVCSTQMVKYQKLQLLGTKGRVEIEVPFNAPENSPCRIFFDEGKHVHNRQAKKIDFKTVNQYTEQVNNFNQKILQKKINNLGMEDAVKNMRVIDAVFKAAKTKKWITV